MSTMSESVAATAASVRVPLGERSYEVLIGTGLLDATVELISVRLGRSKCAIVTDENVARFQLAALEAALKASGLLVGTIVLSPASQQKVSASLDRYASGCSNSASSAAISSSHSVAA